MLVKYAACSCFLPAAQKVVQNRLLSSSASLCAITRPRPPPDRLIVNGNQNKELRDGADYTFLDGRPTPYGGRQLFRIQQQMECAEKIVKYSKELDGVKAETAAKRQAEQDVIKDRLARKLRPKGQSLSKNPRP